MVKHSNLADNQLAIDYYNSFLINNNLEPLSTNLIKTISVRIKESDDNSLIYYSYIVNNDDIAYYHPVYGAELREKVPRTAIIIVNNKNNKTYFTGALPKLAKPSVQTIEEATLNASKLRIFNKLNGKPCSLQLIMLDELYLSFIAKTVCRLVSVSDIKKLDNNDLNKFLNENFDSNDQLKEFFESIKDNIENYIKVLQALGSEVVLTGELLDGRHIVIPNDKISFIVHTAKNKFTNIKFSDLEKECTNFEIPFVLYDDIDIKSKNLEDIVQVLINYRKTDKNTNTEGYVIHALNDLNIPVCNLPWKWKSNLYMKERMIRQLIMGLKSKRPKDDKEKDYPISLLEFQSILDHITNLPYTNPSKVIYIGLTAIGWQKVITWLKDQFIVSALKYKLKISHVDISSKYGHISGFGYVLKTLHEKYNMELLSLDITLDIDSSVENFMNNILDQTYHKDMSTLQETEPMNSKSLVASIHVQPSDLKTIISNLQKGKMSNSHLIVIMMRGLMGCGKSSLAEALVKKLLILGINAVHLEQDKTDKQQLYKAISDARNNKQLVVLARCHIGKTDRFFLERNNCLKNEDKIFQLCLGDIKDNSTFLRSISGILHRDSQFEDHPLNFIDDPNKTFTILKQRLEEWIPYKEGPHYILPLFSDVPVISSDSIKSFNDALTILQESEWINDDGSMTEKMTKRFKPLSECVNEVISTLANPSTEFGIWTNADINQTQKEKKNIPPKILYFCISLDHNDIKKIIDTNDDIKTHLDLIKETGNTIKTEYHVTLLFLGGSNKKPDPMLVDLLGTKHNITITSFSANHEYARFDVELSDHLKKDGLIPHVTLAHFGRNAAGAGTFDATSSITFTTPIILEGIIQASVAISNGNMMISSPHDILS